MKLVSFCKASQCVCACMCVRMCVPVHPCVCVSVRASVCICTCARMRVCAYVFMCLCVRVLRMCERSCGSRSSSECKRQGNFANFLIKLPTSFLFLRARQDRELNQKPSKDDQKANSSSTRKTHAVPRKRGQDGTYPIDGFVVAEKEDKVQQMKKYVYLCVLCCIFLWNLVSIPYLLLITRMIWRSYYNERLVSCSSCLLHVSMLIAQLRKSFPL